MHHLRTLKSKLLLLLIVSVVFCSLAALISLSIQLRESNELLYQSTSETLNYGAERFNTTLNSIESIVRLLLSDDSFLDQLDRWILSPDASRNQLSNTLSNYANNSPYISYMCLLYGDQTIQYSRYYPIASMISEESRKELVAQAQEHAGAVCWSVLEEDPDGLFLSRLIRRVDGFDLRQLGVLTLRINVARLLKDLSTSGNSLSPCLLLTSPDHKILFSSDLSSAPSLDELQKLTGNYGIVRYQHIPYFVVSRDAGFLNWQYYYMISYQTVSNATSWLHFLALAIILLSSSLVLMIGCHILSGITVHFHTLHQKMKAYSLGHFEPLDVGYDYSRRPDELGTAHVQLDAMAVRIQSLINDNYVKQLLIREAELKELQYQINPHFLYNTLESINWYARAAGEIHIPNMVHALGNILRSGLCSAALFSFEQELSLLGDYMTIQQIRYDERLQFSIDASDEIMQFELPKMTLVPLVENAIRYGLDETVEDCRIEVQIFLLPAKIRIFVRNTGSLFEEDVMERLEQKSLEPHGFGIGLNNIRQRIQLTYGTQYGLKVYNAQDMAVVEVLLPRRRFNGGT